jgi:predicted RNA binding protein YcfA (HicA-like mRNA interferase family)
MSKLFSSKEISYVLSKLGFSRISQKGSHGKFKNADGRVVILPMPKKEIPEGTLRSILRQAGTSKEEFIKKLGQ